MNSIDTREKKPVVAVVAVHGVADQVQNATVRKISDLLAAQIVDGSRAGYTTAREIPIRISTRAVQLRDGGSEKARSFHEMSLASHASRQGMAGEGESVDFAFTRKVLEEAPEPEPEDVYETIRIETAKLKAGEPAVDVHLYEMFWTDLSRHGTGVLQIFGELYQILCHLGTLGRSTVDAAALEHSESRQWHSFAKWQSWATDLLVIWIVSLNILIVGLAVIVVLAGLYSNIKVGSSLRWILPWGMVGIAAVAGAASAVRWWRDRPTWLWVSTPLLIIVSIVIGRLLGIGFPWAASELADLIAMSAGVGVSWFIVKKYQERRPGVGMPAIACGIVLLSRVFYAWLVDDSHSGFAGMSAGISGLELMLEILLPGFWMVFLLLLWVSSIVGLSAVGELNADSAKGRRAARAAFTARLTLSLSSAFFAVITIALWAAFWWAVKQSNWFPSWAPYRTLGDGQPTVGHFINSFFQGTRALEFEILVALIGICAVICAWAVGPVLYEELFPPNQSDDALKEGIGHWLDWGYWFMRYAGEILFFGIAGTLAFYLLKPFIGDRLADFHGGAFLGYAGALVGASAVGLTAFRGRLDKLALGLRPIVDVLLDVDNHLREFPHGKNPRAMICARYVSLLRYLAQWRDESGLRGYDEIIIVAHSQGTAISADLLRFLKHEWPAVKDKDPELEPILGGALPLYLFTMGSPLGQLYWLRFPTLYQWAKSADDSNWMQNVSSLIPEGQLPNPDELNVKCWVNAFRSGDYVGRYLWRPSGCPLQWALTMSQDQLGKRKEFCIGAGAHTHYWDYTASEIAAELDRLIGVAATRRLH